MAAPTKSNPWPRERIIGDMMALFGWSSEEADAAYQAAMKVRRENERMAFLGDADRKN